MLESVFVRCLIQLYLYESNSIFSFMPLTINPIRFYSLHEQNALKEKIGEGGVVCRI